MVVPAEKGEAEQNREKNNKLNPETAAFRDTNPAILVGGEFCSHNPPDPRPGK